MCSEGAIDGAVFEQLVRRFGPELRLYCLKLTAGRISLADEILQSAYQVAWDKRAQFKGGNVRAWLYCIARQQGLYRLRSERRYVTLEPTRLRTLATEPEAASGQQDDRQRRLKDGFAALSAMDQTIVRAAYGLRPLPPEVDGEKRLTYEEIGRLVGAEHGRTLSPDGVRMRLKRALARMLRHMAD